jgi:hypothetical protein
VGELGSRQSLSLRFGGQRRCYVLGTRKQLYRTIAMIPAGHRDATDADALGPRGPTGECPQSLSPGDRMRGRPRRISPSIAVTWSTCARFARCLAELHRILASSGRLLFLSSPRIRVMPDLLSPASTGGESSLLFRLTGWDLLYSGKDRPHRSERPVAASGRSSSERERRIWDAAASSPLHQTWNSPV